MDTYAALPCLDGFASEQPTAACVVAVDGGPSGVDVGVGIESGPGEVVVGVPAHG
jgi:hypothetical protein